MGRDRFNLLTWIGLVVAVAALLALVGLTPQGQGSPENAELEQALDQQIAYQARIDFLQRVYAPVEALRQQQALPAALLKLKEIAREYPGEAHGLMLKGEILFAQGALEQALESVAQALKSNGDYVDRNSPLRQRELISRLAETGQAKLAARLREQPDNHAVGKALKDAYYLQSRLAGGCE